MELRNHRQPWAADDYDELRRLAEQRLGADEIALKLGRTPDAIQTKADLEGIRLAQRYNRSRPATGRPRQRSRHSLELDRRRLIQMLDELRSGKINQAPETETERLIIDIEQRFDSLDQQLANMGAD